VATFFIKAELITTDNDFNHLNDVFFWALYIFINIRLASEKNINH
jgi:hypothetical protein